MMRRFPRSVWLFALALAFATSLPYIVGALSTPPGWRYSGQAVLPKGIGVDVNSHFAKMWQGSRGQFSMHILFTHEPNADLPLVHGFYVALGQLSRFLPLNLVQIYHLARFSLTVVMVLAMWAFASRFFEKPGERWLALLFAMVVSGWSWLLLIVDPASTANVSPIEFWLIDAFNLLGALFMPHFAAAVILQTVILLTFDDWVRMPDGRGAWRRLVILSAALVAQVIIQPYSIVLFGPLLVLLAAYHVFSAHRLSWRRALWLLIPFGFQAAFALYQVWTINGDPVWAKFAEQNQTLSPIVTYYLLGYLPFILPIMLGARLFMLSEADDRWWMPILWVALVAMLLYAPLPTQRRYLVGVQTPLAIMAAFGWSRAVLPYFKQKRRVLVSAAYLLVAGVAMLAIILLNTLALTQPTAHREVYDTPDEILAYDWLQRETQPDDLVFITFDGGQTGRGSRLVSAIGHRVFIGHWIETVDFEAKILELKQFYDPATSDSWRRDFLKRIRAVYLWYDEYAQEFGDWNPSGADYLTPVFTSDTITLWKVN